MATQVVNGLVYGALLFSLASGLALMFGLRRIVNFAHGAFYMLGAYTGYVVATVAGFWAGLVGSFVVLAVAGFLLDMAVFRPLQKRDPLTIVLVTFGIALIIEDFVQSIWGNGILSLQQPDLLAGTIEVFGTSFPLYRIAIVTYGAIVAAGLIMWVRYSRFGLFIRAASYDPVITGIQGVNSDRMSAIVVALGAGLAGASGTVAAPLLSLSPAMAGSILVDSFIVVVVGGLGSLGGALVAALVLGQITVFGVVFAPEFTTLLPFVLMIGVLLWRPTGLAGTRM